MKRSLLLGLIFSASFTGMTARAADDGVIPMKSGARYRFGPVQCEARTTTYAYITCFSPGRYEVAVSRQGVIVVRARDGRVVYRTP
jgi:hypothetical protein